MLAEYKDLKTYELLDIILQGSEQSDEVMYFVLNERVSFKLKQKYEIYKRGLVDSYDDCLEEFLIYLRNGHKPQLQSQPYLKLHKIKKNIYFEKWLVSTFNRFLTKRCYKEEICRPLKAHKIADYSDGILSREQMIETVAKLIAYSHQSLQPRNQFVLLRSVLSLLDKANALPDSEIAQAMGMSYNNYRVSHHRIMQKVEAFKKMLEGDELPQLDGYHKAMAGQINEDFENLYPTLIHYYDAALKEQEQEPEITALRNKYYHETGCMLHEPRAPYGYLER